MYYPCCEEPYPDITFRIKLRRKSLFSAVNLMIPCISINLLTFLIFNLPSNSCEKISLGVTLLLSLSVFQLLLMELVPASSITVPFLSKYIIFTMILVLLSVFISVVTLNVNFRSSSTHKLPVFTQKLFLTVLPKLLLMRQPELSDVDRGHTSTSRTNDARGRDGINEHLIESAHDNLNGDHTSSTDVYPSSLDSSSFCEACKKKGRCSYPPDIQNAFDCTNFIVQHLKVKDEGNDVSIICQSLVGG